MSRNVQIDALFWNLNLHIYIYIYYLYLIQKVGNTITPLTLGTTILATDHSKYVVTGTYNLTIVNVQISDEGTYQCVVGVTTREASLQTVGK